LLAPIYGNAMAVILTTAIVAAGLLCFLLYALLRPERF
jgi:K+-transporting ATPase KdpF subunit